MQERNIELLNELKAQVEQLTEKDFNKLDAAKRRAHLLIDKIFDSESKYHPAVNGITFRSRTANDFLGIAYSNSESDNNLWRSGQNKFINLVNTMLEDVSLTMEMREIEVVKNNIEKSIVTSNEIFIVHGHNEEMKQSIARVIEKLDLKPIILHELANKGRTIIQKFIDHSDVGFAIVLMSADDYGYSKTETQEIPHLRARQNVILELGFFLEKLGHDRVIAIFEQVADFEKPSDYDGVIFIPFDKNGKWKFDIIKELKSLNYQVDANKINCLSALNKLIFFHYFI